MRTKRNYRRWSLNEVALIRSAIKNGRCQNDLNLESDLNYLSRVLNRNVGSICCRIGREKMQLGLSPKGFTGNTIGYKALGPIVI